jgi:hypothetical protein
VAQPGGIGLQGVAGLIGWLLAEHVIDEPIERDDGAAAEQERRQQGPLARPWHRDGPTGHPDLQRPQDAELHLALQPAHPPTLHRYAHRCRQRSRPGSSPRPWWLRITVRKVAYSRRTPVVLGLYAPGTRLTAAAGSQWVAAAAEEDP